MLVIKMYQERLKQLRERLGLTQKEVADYLKIDSSHYGHLEVEYEIMPIKHLNALVNYFNVSIDYFFNFTDIKQYENSQKEIDKKVSGNRLKEFRKEHKLTQVKLANILNTVHPVIVNYEKGKHLIATPFLYEICKTYHISADYILGKTDSPKYY